MYAVFVIIHFVFVNLFNKLFRLLSDNSIYEILTLYGVIHLFKYLFLTKIMLYWFQDEITTVRQLQHRNVIKYLASFISGNHLWIVMPLIGYTSASRLIVSHFTNGLPEPALALIFKDILCGLHYLHSKGIIHR